MKLLKSIFLLFFAFLIKSCSIPTYFFVQNLLQEDCELKIIYKVPIDELPKSGNYKIEILNGLVDAKTFNKAPETKELKLTQVNDSTLILKIPKQSTIRIAQTSNMYFQKTINQVEINENRFSIDKLITESSRKKGMFSYKIEK